MPAYPYRLQKGPDLQAILSRDWQRNIGNAFGQSVQYMIVSGALDDDASFTFPPVAQIYDYNTNVTVLDLVIIPNTKTVIYSGHPRVPPQDWVGGGIPNLAYLILPEKKIWTMKAPATVDGTPDWFEKCRITGPCTGTVVQYAPEYLGVPYATWYGSPEFLGAYIGKRITSTTLVTLLAGETFTLQPTGTASFIGISNGYEIPCALFAYNKTPGDFMDVIYPPTIPPLPGVSQLGLTGDDFPLTGQD